MANDLTHISKPSSSVSLYSASNDEIHAILNGRCDQGRLVDALQDLMGLYYQPDDTPEQRARHIALFVADLSDMSDQAVHWAIREWRRNQDRRPSPAALRQLCMRRRQEAMTASASRMPKAHAAPEPIPSDEQRKVMADRIAEIAAKAGFVRTEAGQFAFPERPEDAPKRVPHWSETAAPDDPRWAAVRKARAANELMSRPFPGDAA